MYHYLFGPVPSRRLGISLGIDLVPHKTCTFDCLYCECGKTTDLTITRKEYTPHEEVCTELKHYLERNPEPDYITFSGSGEPTLHNSLGTIIAFIKTHYPEIKVAVITNASLLSLAGVRMELRAADLIMPSLDAVSNTLFRKINRPCAALHIDDICEGLVQLRQEFSGYIWLEIFIVPHLNDTQSELHLLKQEIERIQPDCIQLNSLDRPGTEKSIATATEDNLERVKQILDHPCVEIIARNYQGKINRACQLNVSDRILETLTRRPCTLDDLTTIFSMSERHMLKFLFALETAGKISQRVQDRGIFYRAEL